MMIRGGSNCTSIASCSGRDDLMLVVVGVCCTFSRGGRCGTGSMVRLLMLMMGTICTAIEAIVLSQTLIGQIFLRQDFLFANWYFECNFVQSEVLTRLRGFKHWLSSCDCQREEGVVVGDTTLGV
eukprot:TRINITY_DN24204_c0_g1_i1.p2 TRINITY_DN24204_c0_g1~~TRINITY_DN24204_c0_g1_i1.p2  ORF type:complete len:125 (-),score=12.28 TRINITY_DN24204_c0_g1_i1:109-483(-)